MPYHLSTKQFSMQTSTNQLKTRVAGIAHCALLLVLLFTTSVYAQDPAQYGTPFASVPDPRDVNMYQVHIRPYSTAGNLAGVTTRLDAIKALGINVIYLMPIYPHGTDSRSSASPYSIKDFKSVATEYGSLTDMRTLVDGAHSRGMAVMLDFAVNGTSWDHPWITQHPDWYIQSGGVIQQLATFPDVAAFNFNNTSMRAALVDAMRYWIFAANIDGYRCDFANNPPLDFWTNTISNLRGITSHRLLMLAEGDRLENFQTGFDYNFGDKWYYDAIKPIANGTSVGQLQTTTNTEYTFATGSQQEVRYTANHDTETNETAIGVFKSHSGVIANFLVSGYMRGVPFLTSGQEVDFNQTIPWPYTSVKINWGANTGAAADFAKVLNFRNSSNAIRRGTMTNYSDANVCAFTKISGSEKVVVITNLRNSTSNYVIPSAFAGSYKDAYSGATITLTSGATQSMGAFQYMVLTNANVAQVAVTGVSVSPASASISAGTTRQLAATITPSNATNQNVSWSSSNAAVATVNASGLVTGVTGGNATITVTTQDGNKTASAAITVTPSTNFTVNFYRPSAWGTGIRIYWWAAQPSGILADGTWPGVLMTNAGNGWYSYTFTNVTSTNLIFNDGTTQTADLTRNKTGWYQNNTWYDTNPGSPILVTGVTVSPTSATVNVNATTQLTATVAPSNATNKTVTWTSTNTAIATVSATGLVTAKASGVATITVTTQDGNKTATCSITVPGGVTTYYAIQNRWKGTYLFDAGANVGYGTTIANNNYKWEKVTVDATYFWLRNLGTGEYMHIENQTGSVQCAAADISWWSSQWSQDNVDGTYVRFRNRWQAGSIIHVENQTGFAQYANAQDGWYSAQWQLIAATGSAGGRLRGTETALYESETEEGEMLVEIYPNPSRGKEFTVSIPRLKENELAQLAVHDLNGRIVHQAEIQNSGTIKHNLNPGLYFIKVRSSKFQRTKKIVIE
jgi:uncharacterized protein YjdB